MGEDLRRHHRLGVSLEMRVRGVDRAGLPFEESTSSDDVSRGGCSFLSSHDVEMGTELELEILRRSTVQRPPTPFLTKGAVQRVSHRGPNLYFIGVQFTGPRFPTFSSETTSGP